MTDCGIAPFEIHLPSIVWLQLLVNETWQRVINSGRALCAVKTPLMQRVDARVLAEGELTDLKTRLLQGPTATKTKQAAQT